nr:GDSL esterase/lipase At5g03610-like [Ipomoea batatas]
MFLFVLIISDVNGARRQPQDKLILNDPEKLFVFGDSYADTGNWPPTDASRPWREPYAAYLGIGSPQAYSLWNGDEEAKQYGMNFAYGGTGVFDTFEGGPNMTTQINYLQQLIQQNVYTKHDLTSSVALVTSVGNDYRSYHHFEKFVESITKQLSLNLKRIHEMGVPKVAVTAMQPLGCLPMVAFATGKYPNCDENTNNITRFHNQMLKQRVDKLNDQTDGSPFVIVDLYAAFTTALNIKHNQHPGKSSFPHPLAPCCLGNCGEVDVGGKKEYGLCDDPKMAFFWDMTHPSQQGWFAVYSALKSSLPHLFHHPQQETPIV